MARIDCNHIRHAYGPNPKSGKDYALKEVHHTFEDGGAYALLGPSGCGKTTLLNIISGLLHPSHGELLFDGRDVTNLSTQERNIAQVFQFPVIYDTMTVYDNLAFPLRNRGVPEADVDRKVRETLEMTGLADMAKRKARGLTADQKQKISLGRGLVRSDVNAILFDEPLTVIDPHMKWVLRSQLKQLHRRFGFTMVYVTHDQTEALTFAENVVVMYEGEVVQIGSPAELFERPKHTFVGYFIGSPGMNVMPVAVEGRSARLGSQTIELPGAPKAGTKGAIELGIRPEYVRLGRSRHAGFHPEGRGYRPPQGGARELRRPRHRGDRRRGRGHSGRPEDRFRSRRHQPLRRFLARRDGRLSLDRTWNNKAWFMVLPVLLLVAFSAVIPLMTVVNYSVQDTFGNNQFFWAGTAWFEEILHSARFWEAMGRNLVFSAIILIIQIPLGIFIALNMPKKGWGVPVCLVLMALPLLIPWNVVGTIWQVFGRVDIGLLGYTLRSLGFDYNYVNDPFDAWVTVIVMDVWHWTSLVVLLCYAGLVSIPDAYYQAAKIDGASRWAIFRYIQLPKMNRVLLIAVLLRFMDSFMIYTEPFVVTGGGPGNTTTFLSIDLVKLAIGEFNLGEAAAMSIVYFLIIMLLSWVFYTVMTAYDAEQ